MAREDRRRKEVAINQQSTESDLRSEFFGSRDGKSIQSLLKRDVASRKKEVREEETLEYRKSKRNGSCEILGPKRGSNTEKRGGR